MNTKYAAKFQKRCFFVEVFRTLDEDSLNWSAGPSYLSIPFILYDYIPSHKWYVSSIVHTKKHFMSFQVFRISSHSIKTTQKSTHKCARFTCITCITSIACITCTPRISCIICITWISCITCIECISRIDCTSGMTCITCITLVTSITCLRCITCISCITCIILDLLKIRKTLITHWLTTWNQEMQAHIKIQDLSSNRTRGKYHVCSES